MVDLVGRAARTIYETKKTTRRGEIGELLLHVAIRQTFKTVPAISKFFFKDAANDTVKGFDAVHVVATATELELWLGEAKFYKSITRAIAAAVDEVKEHVKKGYLRKEFAFITNKIDDSWPHASRLKLLLNQNTSLDAVFARLCIPVFLTYESPVIKGHKAITHDYLAQFSKEIKQNHSTFQKAGLPTQIRLHLFLLPLHTKKALVDEFDERLRRCQALTN